MPQCNVSGKKCCGRAVGFLGADTVFAQLVGDRGM